MKKILKWFIGLSLIVLSLLMIGLHMMGISTQMSDQDIQRSLLSKHSHVTVDYIETSHGTMRYVMVEHSSVSKETPLPLLICLHGAPGSWADFEEYLQDERLQSRYRMVSVDRLGYGASSYGHPYPDIRQQAEAIQQLVWSLRDRTSEVVIMGHSYGGPIAGYLASEQSLVDYLIMLAPVNDPFSEPVFWFSKVLDWPVVYNLMPGFVQAATVEKMQHPEQLKKMMHRWTEINIPAYHLHSSIDWIAPGIANMDFSKRFMDLDCITVIERPDKDHFIPWNDFQFVSDLLMSLELD